MSVTSAISGIRRLVKGPGLATGRRSAQVVAVCAHKGGVGKTTTAVHIAAGLARFHGRKTLLLDMDAQAHVGTSLSAVARRPRVENGLGKVLLERRRDVQEIVEPTSIDNLWLAPSDPRLADTEKQMAAKIGREVRLRQALRIARTHFDVIVVDSPPNAGGLTVSALVAADYVLVPSELTSLSLDGIGNAFDTVADVQETLNPELKLLGVLRTRVDRRRTTVNEPLEAQLRDELGDDLLESVVGVSTDIAKAQADGKTLFEFAPNSRAARNYASACEEIDRRLDTVTWHRAAS